jgi:hypothetical protein
MSEGPLLRPEEVAGVLSGMGANAPEPAAAGAGPGPTPYSLREPVAIPPGAEGEAKKRMASICAALQEALRHELGEDVTLEVDGFQQQAAAAALSAIPAPAWVPSFACETGGGLALVLAPGTALALVERALGGAGGLTDAAREPTPLELRVLGKLGASAAGPLGRMFRGALAPGELGVGRVPRAVAAAGETVGVGLIRVRLGKAERSALVLVAAGLLAPPTAEARAAAIGAGPLAPALGRVRAETRPVLRAGRVSFGELVELKQGTVLLLDAAEDSRLDLRVAGQALFRGRVARGKDGSEFRVEWRRGRHAPSARRNRQ